MKHDRWHLGFVLALTIGSPLLLTACSHELGQQIQTVTTWIKDRNRLDPTPANRFIGTGIGYADEITFPKQLWIPLEDRTECVGNPQEAEKLPLRSIPPQFKRCLAELAKQTQVPILIPAKLPRSWVEDAVDSIAYTFIREKPFYGNSSLSFTRYQGEQGKQGYSIGLIRYLNDRLAYYQAKVGFIAGKVITQNTPTLETMAKEESVWEKNFLFHSTIQTVVLADGIRAYYFPPACFANCNSAYGRVIWEQNGYQYAVGIMMGRLKEVVETANSMIENQR